MGYVMSNQKSENETREKPMRHARLKLTADIYEHKDGVLWATGEVVELVDNNKMATVMECQGSSKHVVITTE